MNLNSQKPQMQLNERGRVLKVNTQQEQLTKFDVPSLISL